MGAIIQHLHSKQKNVIAEAIIIILEHYSMVHRKLEWIVLFLVYTWKYYYYRNVIFVQPSTAMVGQANQTYPSIHGVTVSIASWEMAITSRRSVRFVKNQHTQN